MMFLLVEMGGQFWVQMKRRHMDGPIHVKASIEEESFLGILNIKLNYSF
jgi:hypothetical protein